MAAPLSMDAIRTMFSSRLSDMFRSEVPRYSALTRIVAAVNDEVLAARPQLRRRLQEQDEVDRLGLERHGAVRVGTARELVALRRMFAAMGMAPVGYYDLSAAGLPVHSTAFRPVTDAALRRNPFRVFVSLLRLELIEDRELRAEVAGILARRNIATRRCLELLDVCENAGGLSEAQAKEFVSEAIETFRWRPQAAVSIGVYRKLHATHPLIADIACFCGPHLNHLTVATLDIDAVQRALTAHDLDPKEAVEGPPTRRRPILLRQTAFKAQAEPISFAEAGEGAISATHAARFGEVEQRGAALTPKGLSLYDRLLAATGELSKRASLEERFKDFPDDDEALWREGLAFFCYSPTAEGLRSKNRLPPSASTEELLRRRALEIEPIVYEDFLPVSAAGIFRSNLAHLAEARSLEPATRAAFEDALGAPTLDASSLYEATEKASLSASLDALGLPRGAVPAKGDRARV